MFRKISILFYFSVCLYGIQTERQKYIENFNTANDISQWIEHSDTIQDVGKSKATLVLLQTAKSQRAVLFTLLDPQPCGAAFAGIKKQLNFDLSSFKHIILRVRGKGSYHGYKLILHESRFNYSFCSFFEASPNFGEVALKLEDLAPYYEGKLIKNPEVQINLSKVTSIGIQAYGGIFLPIKQSGVGSLEIEWIRVE